MSTSEPIKHKKDIDALKEYFLNRKEYRNYTLITMGLNTALRISDLLLLKWKNVYNEITNNFYNHIYVIEKKTKKESRIPINPTLQQTLRFYRKHFNEPTPSSYLFYNTQNPLYPISRIQAYRIIERAARDLEFEGHISCHSLRKTFGYQAWKEGAEPALLMSVFNHSSYEITKKYLCIDQDDKDALFLQMSL